MHAGFAPILQREISAGIESPEYGIIISLFGMTHELEAVF
jgi:hypothetical protein